MDGYLLYILSGAWLTLAVALLSILVAVTLGLLGALAKMSEYRVLRWPATLYSTIVRGIPDLVLMLLVFYGAQVGVNAVANALDYSGSVDINPFVAGCATIGFIYGAYLTEVFRGAILAIPRGQIEAATAFGMRRMTILWRIILPQMVRLALPGFTNTWLVLVKATALVSVIGLADMMYRAKQASGATRSAFLYFFATALIYLLITSLSLYALGAIEKRYTKGIRRANT